MEASHMDHSTRRHSRPNETSRAHKFSQVDLLMDLAKKAGLSEVDLSNRLSTTVDVVRNWARHKNAPTHRGGPERVSHAIAELRAELEGVEAPDPLPSTDPQAAERLRSYIARKDPELRSLLNGFKMKSAGDRLTFFAPNDVAWSCINDRLSDLSALCQRWHGPNMRVDLPRPQQDDTPQQRLPLENPERHAHARTVVTADLGGGVTVRNEGGHVIVMKGDRELGAIRLPVEGNGSGERSS